MEHTWIYTKVPVKLIFPVRLYSQPGPPGNLVTCSLVNECTVPEIQWVDLLMWKI